jgi:hypothetical protein
VLRSKQRKSAKLQSIALPMRKTLTYNQGCPA